MLEDMGKGTPGVELLSRGWLSQGTVTRIWPMKGRYPAAASPATSGTLIMRVGDSNGAPFVVCSGHGEHLLVAGSIVETLLEVIPCPGIKWYEGSSRTGLSYGTAIWASDELLLILRAEHLAGATHGMMPWSDLGIAAMAPSIAAAEAEAAAWKSLLAAMVRAVPEGWSSYRGENNLSVTSPDGERLVFSSRRGWTIAETNFRSVPDWALTVVG